MNNFIVANEFLSNESRPYRDVDLPAPFEGKKVRVVGLSAEDASEFGKTSGAVLENGEVVVSSVASDILARLLSKTLADENFNMLFTEADVTKINKQSAKMVLMLANVAMELSGLREDAKDTAGKNSQTPDVALPTA